MAFHDMSLERMTNGDGLVADTTLEDLKKLNVGQGERIVTLEEVLDLVDRRAIVNIEIKGIGVADRLAEILGEYIKRKGWSPEMFIVTSFNKKEFHKFALINPDVRLSILVGRDFLSSLIMAKRYKAYSVHLPQPYMKRRLVRFFQKRGFKVFIYTLNSIWDIAKAKVMGVDGIFSDYPDRI